MSDAVPVHAMGHEEPTTIWNKSFVVLFVANFVFNMGLNMSNTLIPVYANYFGASAALVGLVTSSTAFSSFGVRFISAPMMDTYNRKYLLIASAAMLSISFIGYSMATNIQMLIGFRLLQGCGLGFGNSCCMAMASGMLPRDKFSAGMGYYSLAQTACQAIGPSVGLELVGRFGFPATYAITACTMLCAAFLAFQIRINYTRTKKLKISLQNSVAIEALKPSSLMLVMIIGGTIVNSFLVISSKAQGISGNIGLYFTVSAITMFVTRPAIGRLTDRFGIVKVTIPAFLCNVVAYFIISYATSLGALLVAGFIVAFGQGACFPAFQALIMKTVPPEKRGAASCTNFMGMDIGFLIGPMRAGHIAEALGYPAMWRLMSASFIVCMLIVFLCRSQFTRIEEEFAVIQAGE
jgi:MFS family permease